MGKKSPEPEKGFFNQLKAVFSGLSQCKEVRIREEYKLRNDRIRVPFEGYPLQLVLGEKGQKLHIYPERSLDGSNGGISPRFILFDPDRYYSRISGFMRLSEGDTLILGKHDERQEAIFNYPKGVARRHLAIVHDGDALIFKDLATESGTLISPLMGKKVIDHVLERRMENLREIRTIYGGPIEPLDHQQALATLEAVNELLEKEPCRPRDTRGRPGGVVSLPNKMIPIIVGDIHAQVDNLLTLLSQNEFLEAMGDGKAALVFLGDAVHSEVDGQMEDMDSSILMMDLILRLKLWFPQQVFYIRGNHDSFSPDIGKDGIPQGLLWEMALRRSRSEEYKKAMERFYELLPYVAVSDDYVACHAAPPKGNVGMDLLVNIDKYPGLVDELINNRLQRPNRPAGYTGGDVKRFRKALDLADDTEFFVGHTPMTRDDTLWLKIGGIENHHVIFSGNTPWIGVFTQIGKRMIPLRYHTEHLLPVINALAE